MGCADLFFTKSDKICLLSIAAIFLITLFDIVNGAVMDQTGLGNTVYSRIRAEVRDIHGIILHD